MKRAKQDTKLVMLALLVTAGWWLPSAKLNAQETEYKSYSLFIYNFIKYIEWPPDAFEANNFVIGVIGESKIIPELEALAKNKKAHGKIIVIKKYASVADIDNCNLLFVPSSKSSVLKQVAEKTKGKSILIVAEREGLAKRGASINFLTMDDETLKFEVNKKELESHKLKIALTLLELAFVVG